MSFNDSFIKSSTNDPYKPLIPKDSSEVDLTIEGKVEGAETKGELKGKIEEQFKEIGEIFSKLGVKKESREKIFKEWRKLLNQEKTSVDENSNTINANSQITKKVAKSKLFAVTSEKSQPYQSISDVESLSTIESTLQEQGNILKEIHSALEQIEEMDKDFKQASVLRKLVSSDNFDKLIFERELKKEKKELEKILKELLKPKNIKELIDSDMLKNAHHKLDSIKENINFLQIFLTPQEVWKPALEEIFKDSPIGYVDNKAVDAANLILDKLDKLDPDKWVYLDLRRLITNLWGICNDARRTLYYLGKVEKTAIEKYAKKDIEEFDKLKANIQAYQSKLFSYRSSTFMGIMIKYKAESKTSERNLGVVPQYISEFLKVIDNVKQRYIDALEARKTPKQA